MGLQRKVVFASMAIATMFVLSNAGGCSSREDEEHLGKQSQALDGTTGDGGCREVTLEASRAQDGGGRPEDERELSPPMRLEVPSEIALSNTTNSLAHWIELKIELASGSEGKCRYKGGAGNPNDRALLVSCEGVLHAGDIVRAEKVGLEVDDGSVATARVTLAEAAPCGPDGSTDASAGVDVGAGVDAADAAGPGADATTCTAASCDTHNACSIGQCTASGCTVTPAAAGTACSLGPCTAGDTCNGSGSCVAGVLVPIDDANPCTVDQCDPVLGVVHTPVAAGTSCSDGNACNGLETCDAVAACQPGTPPPIDDNNLCTDDACDPVAGVTHTPRLAGDTICSDGNACNGVESCNGAGVCVPGAPPPIDDQNFCTVDSCNPATGPTHTLIPSCDPTPFQGDAPFETRASIMGIVVASGGGAVTGASFTVTNAPAEGAPPNTPRTDVSASTASDGSFRVRLTTFPEVEADRTPPLHVLVRIEASGFLPAYRDAWLHSGSAVDLGVVRLITRDPAVTNIGPAGGTASDSQNRISVVIPPGALTTTLPIQITPVLNRDDMPAQLPNNTVTEYGYELEPSGTQFAVPVTVRVANFRNAPTTLAIPAAFYDTDRGRWEHIAVATWDGSRFSFQTTHFTTGDLNGSRPTHPDPFHTHDPEPNDGPDDPCVGSSACLRGGALKQDFKLPTYRVKNEDFGLVLTYQSALAGSTRLGAAPTDYAAVNHSTFAVPVRGMRFEQNAVPLGSGQAPAAVQPGVCTSAPGATLTFGGSPAAPLTLTRSLAGATTTETFSMGPQNAEVEFGGYVDLPMSSTTSASGTGLYRTRMVLRSQTPGSCVASGGTFGVSDYAAPGTQTSLENGPLAAIDTFTLVHHRLTSPFGAGWGVGDVSRVHRDGDLAYLVSGQGTAERFAPRAHAKGLASPVGTVILARDGRTGEIFTARDTGSVERVDPLTGALTPVLSGLGFNASVLGLTVAYVGTSREFVVALRDRLLEIDAGGGQRVLTTRALGSVFAQATAAARDDVVFYTDANGGPLYRIRLSDAARTLESMTLATGGDVRLYPRAPLSGVSFADPRGLAFGSDGTLYVADRGRNVVYAVSPEATGAIGASSHVEPVVGDGQGDYLAPAGERQPGVRFSLREPLGLSVTEDGLLFVTTTYGITSFDPLAREAETLVLWGGIDELKFRIDVRLSVVGLTGSSALVHVLPASGANVVRLDVDRMSSERNPTRTFTKLASGEVELTDTTTAVVERFDVAGRLILRKKRTGETVMAVSYVDARTDAIDRVTDAAGGETVFAYSGGKIQSITDARGRTTQLTVNDLGDLVSLTEPGNETHRFTYAEHRMTEKRSPRTDLTQYSYRSDGTIQSATRPEGAVTVVDAALSHPPVFNAAAKVERHGSYTDARGVLHDIIINVRGGIEKDTHVEDGITRVDTVTYAPDLMDMTGTNGDQLLFDQASSRRNRQLLVASRAVNGVQVGTTVQFDAHGRVVREVRPPTPTGSSDVHRSLYDAAGWEIENMQGPSGVVNRFERDALGHVTRVYDHQINFGPTGREKRWTYRADGLPLTMVEHGVTRTYSYDELPGALNEAGWTDTLGRSIAFTRDANGNVTSTSDGTTTTFAAYDARNRVTETRDALNNTTTYGYTNAGCGCSQEDLVTSIHTPDLAAGVDWTMTYDRDARLASVTDPNAFTETYAYESTGELKKVTDKLARDTTWSHDQLGRVLAMVDTLGRRHQSAYTVPASGAWTGPSLMAGGADATAPTTSLTGTLRSGDYQIGHNAYQPAGAAPAISLYRDATFALGFTHTFDAGNRPTRRTDRTSFAIDSTTIPPGTAGALWDDIRSYEVTSGLPLLTTQSAQRTTGAIESGFMTRNFELDLLRTNGFGSSGLGDTELSETFTRDIAGRPTSLVRRFPGLDFNGGDVISTYAYRPDGRIAQIVNRDGTHDFTYDARGLMLTQVVSGEGTYTYGYDVMGRPSSLTYPDGHTRTQLYDDLGRVVSRCYEYSGPTTRCYTAQYDAVGNPTRMADPEGADVLEYDALDRLKKVTREVGGVAVNVETYDYNALGALKVNGGVALDDQRPRLDGAGNADAAVPASVGGQPVVLDAGGRVTSLRGTSFTWSREGFLRQAQEPIPAVAESYDVAADFRRIAKIQGGNKEFYVYEGLDRIATLASSGAVVEQYLFDGIDHPLRIKMPATSTTAYYELDLAGNVRGLRASGGASLGGYRYSAFGQTLEDTTSITQPLRWKGRWFSPVAGGTYDVRARQWSPELGVFLTVDAFAEVEAATTLWGWPGQNPERWADPRGRSRSSMADGWARFWGNAIERVKEAWLDSQRPMAEGPRTVPR